MDLFLPLQSLFHVAAGLISLWQQSGAVSGRVEKLSAAAIYLQIPWNCFHQPKDPHLTLLLFSPLGFLVGQRVPPRLLWRCIFLDIDILPGHQTKAFHLSRQRSTTSSSVESFLTPERTIRSWHLWCTAYTVHWDLHYYPSALASSSAFCARPSHLHLPLPLGTETGTLSRREMSSCLHCIGWGGSRKGEGEGAYREDCNTRQVTHRAGLSALGATIDNLPHSHRWNWESI